MQSKFNISSYYRVLTLHKKFSIKDFFSLCDPIRSFLRIWSHLLKKTLMENFMFAERELSLPSALATPSSLPLPAFIYSSRFRWTTMCHPEYM